MNLNIALFKYSYLSVYISLGHCCHFAVFFCVNCHHAFLLTSHLIVYPSNVFLFIFLAPTGALEKAMLYVRACVRACVRPCVTFLKRTLQMSF